MAITLNGFLEFLLDVFDKLKNVGVTIVTSWGKSLEELIDESPLSDVGWLSTITEWIADNTGLLDVSLGGIVLGSIGLILVITFVKWFLGIIPFV